MLTGRSYATLRPQHVERADKAWPRLSGLDHVVHKTPFRGHVRVVEALLLVGDQLVSLLRVILERAAVDDVDGTLGPHHRDLG